MMTDLRLDLPLLAQLRDELAGIAQTFNDADPVAHELSEAVGDAGGLAHQVDRFATGWDIRRHEITDSLTAIQDSVSAIRDTFTEVDTKLAQALLNAVG